MARALCSTDMTADPFAEAARAEAERRAPLDGQPAPALAQEREGLVAMAEWARAHLAAQEPTDAECIAFWHAFEDAADETNMENIRAALRAARAARRDKENRDG